MHGVGRQNRTEQRGIDRLKLLYGTMGVCTLWHSISKNVTNYE